MLSGHQPRTAVPEPLTLQLRTSISLDPTQLPWPDDGRARVRLTFGTDGRVTVNRYKGHVAEAQPLELLMLAGDTLVFED
jgi:hypothetical protein